MKDNIYDMLDELGAEVEDTLDRLMGDEELYNEYLEKFPQNQNVILLQEAIEVQDYDTAKKEVHTLKGVALNLGLLPLADACMMMLMDLREGKKTEGAAQMSEVLNQFNLFKDAIEAE